MRMSERPILVLNPNPNLYTNTGSGISLATSWVRK